MVRLILSKIGGTMKISVRTRVGMRVPVLFVVLRLGLPAIAGDSRQPMIGDAAPAFALKSFDGKTLSLEEQRGNFLVLHFAASW
jgi:AhpC/TSA family